MRKVVALICGGRTLDPAKVEAWLAANCVARLADDGLEISKIIHGKARGADTGAHNFAINYRIPVKGYAANWNAFPRNAGPLRNLEMIIDGKPDVVLAFPGDSGTADMTSKARKYGIPVITISGDFLTTVQPLNHKGL